jgi:excisionase family DNA binding protein|tara:strand:- start:662 stop:865 length:204 start_codon:yes stop_codon:yes gene_type:complete
MKNTNKVQFYSISEISDILNVDYRTIAKRVTSGEIPHYKLGHKTIRVRIEDFNKWLEESHVKRNTMG